MEETAQEAQEHAKREIPLKILTVHGYFERFYEIHQDFERNRDAFLVVESELREIGQDFGVEKRYSHYRSFKSAKYRFDRTR